MLKLIFNVFVTTRIILKLIENVLRNNIPYGMTDIWRH